MMHEGQKLTSCNSMPSSQFFTPNFLLQMHTLHEDHQDHHPPTSLTQLLPPSDPRDYQGVTTFLGKRSMSFPGLEACEEATGEDDLSDDCSQLGEKKRRLNMEQVKTLEKNFELGNKLEPERKIQLARALGLQPRQIAIWFQNRRARWKTKQLEKDYDVLKRQFEALKSDNDILQAHNKKLQAEIMALKGIEPPEPINLNKENEGSCSNRSDNSSDLNLGMSRTQATPDSPPSSHPSTNRSFLQSHRPTSMTQLHHNSSSSSRPDLMHCPKAENGAVQDESFCNMFTNLDDQTGFWSAWHDQHNFH